MLAVQPSQVEVFLTDLISGFADQDIKKHKFELQDGHLAATGYVLAQSMTGEIHPLMSITCLSQTGVGSHRLESRSTPGCCLRVATPGLLLGTEALLV